MERVIVVNWAILCITILLVEVASSISIHESDTENFPTQEKIDNNKIKESFLKFASKIERKKRHLENNDFYENFQKEGLDRLILNAIRNTPWIDIVTTSKNDGKRNVVNFTPRLGRESGENINELRQNGGINNQWMQDGVFPDQILYQRSPPFAPRLGRNSPESVIPRLGRELNGKLSLS